MLLLDLETKRFDILPLEFDSLEAVVSDVIARIPKVFSLQSHKDEVLRPQSYSRIADRDGKELPPSMRLATFCKDNNEEVLVAVPLGVDAREWCTRLGILILSDDNVVDMVR